MMIYDHKDQKDRLDTFHYPRFKQGNMCFSAIVCCFDGGQDWNTMCDTIRYVENAILHSKHFSFDDTKDIQVFMAVEGMCGIDKDPEERIDWLYMHHVRLASLCWNDDNALACGAKKGNKPLTDLGKRVIKEMNQVNMAIDTSHCCEWNFYHIALGFDFMDYIPGMEDSNVIGMKDITQIQNIATALQEHGFAQQEIEDICFNNAYNFMKNYI